MYIQNITFNIENGVFDQWKEFMNKAFIPFSHSQGKFAGQNILRAEVEDENTKTYIFQLFAEERETIDAYVKDIYPALQRETQGAFGERVMLFTTTLAEETI